MKKTFVILNIMLLAMSLCVLKAEDKYSCFLSKDSVDLDMGQLRASMYLNECAYSLTKIKESGNKIVVLEEQDKLINDYRWEYVTSYSSVMEFRERLQESLNTMLINEIDRERFNKEFSRKNNDAARNSLMSAISGVQISVNPLSLITNVLITSARAYMDYGRRKDELSVELGDKYWELEKSHMNEITSLRSQLFNVIQETFGDYKISDDMYLRENNFEKLFSIISSREAELKVEALEENKEIFQSFPPYWYELGCSYIDLYKDTNKTSYLSHAWAAFDRYKEMNDACPMLIEDERSGMISLYKLQYWPDLSDDDIRLLIKDVEKNVSGEANALLYAATQFALKLDMPNESLDMIRRCLVDYPSLSCKDEFVLAAASIWESVTSIKSKSLFITAVTKEISGLTLDTYLLLIKTLMHDEDINVYPLIYRLKKSFAVDVKEWDAGNIKTFSLVCLGEGRKYFIYDDSKWKVELEDHNVLAGTHYIYPASRKFANPDLFYETDEDFVKALSKIKYFKEYPLEIEKLHLASKTELGDKTYYFLSDNCQWDNIYESLEYLDYYQENDKAKYRYKSVVEEKYKEFYEKNKVDEIEYDYCLEERKEINIKQYKHFPRYVLIFNVYESKNPDVNIRLFFTTDFISEKHTRFTFDGISFNNQYIRL